jgi:aminoacrylate hydrolase
VATLQTQGISLYYETCGDRRKPPVMLISGLGGAGASWGAQTARFAKDYFVVVPDHRGTGRTTRATDGYTIAQHAADMAALIEHLELGPTHIVGTSTGGAIGQLMALDHAETVRSVTMASSFARADDYFRREFALRRKLVAESDAQTIFNAYALFLFAPRYISKNPERVAAWVERASGSHPFEREIALKRIDMILAHDALSRFAAIRQPVLVLCGDHDFCAPPHLSEEIAQAIPGSQFAIFEGGGHFIDVEQEERFFVTVRSFIDRQPAAAKETAA